MALFRGGQVDDLDDSTDDLKGYTSLMIGEAPEVHRFSSEDDERKFLVERILSLADDFSKRERPLESLCIAARTTTILNRRVIPALQAAKLPYQQLTGIERPDQDEVCIATFHRVKGTEFPVVILVGVEEASVPVGSAETTEDVERERATLFVAATRAREGLMVTVVGADSRFLSGV
jgi:superfamily I DNA/RNA helicase